MVAYPPLLIAVLLSLGVRAKVPVESGATLPLANLAATVLNPGDLTEEVGPVVASAPR
jgi:hypothetical protein